MILLDPRDYDKVTAPLQEVTINKLFVWAVLEKKVAGSVYVDQIEKPETFFVRHPYGMSMLFGKTDNLNFNSCLRDYVLNIFKIRNTYEWLQVFPDEWNKKMSELFGDILIQSVDNIGQDKNQKIEVNTRVNFKFNREKYLRWKSSFQSRADKIVRTDKFMFDNMNGSVVPRYFWDDADHFCKDGVGFTLEYDNRMASTAYSAFIHENQLEIGIETNLVDRGKGFALSVCSSLIDYCIEYGYEPLWACKFENTGSFRLAQKLGFEPSLFIPFYRLNP